MNMFVIVPDMRAFYYECGGELNSRSALPEQGAPAARRGWISALYAASLPQAAIGFRAAIGIGFTRFFLNAN